MKLLLMLFSVLIVLCSCFRDVFSQHASDPFLIPANVSPSGETTSHVQEVNRFPLKKQDSIESSAGRAFSTSSINPIPVQERLPVAAPVYVPSSRTSVPGPILPASKKEVPKKKTTIKDLLEGSQWKPIPYSNQTSKPDDETKQDRTLNIQPEERSSYSSYDPAAPSAPPSAYNQIDRNFQETPPVPVPQYYQNPQGNYHVQQPYPQYNYVNELSEKFDNEEYKEKYLEETAKFIGGTITGLFGKFFSSESIMIFQFHVF